MLFVKFKSMLLSVVVKKFTNELIGTRMTFWTIKIFTSNWIWMDSSSKKEIYYSQFTDPDCMTITEQDLILMLDWIFKTKIDFFILSTLIVNPYQQENRFKQKSMLTSSRNQEVRFVHLGLVSCIYVHQIIDIHSGTRTLKTDNLYPKIFIEQIMLWSDTLFFLKRSHEKQKNIWFK